MLSTGRRQRSGFTLVELAVTMVLVVVLALLAAPQMRLYTVNARIHSTAEAFAASVHMARAESIRRNAPVEVVLTDQAAIVENVETDSLTLTGPNWIVRQPAGVEEPQGAALFIEGFMGDADGEMVTTGASNTIRFNAAGGLTKGGMVKFTHGAIACAPDGAARCLRVTVSSGGSVRLCDPQATANDDTRRC